jgi:peptide/nickel transport system permease protein
MTPAKRAILVQQLGLNDSIPVQYIRWLIGDDYRLFDTNGDGKFETTCNIVDGEQVCGPDKYGTRKGLLRGDFGYSYSNKRPVMALVGERVGATLEMQTLALLFGSISGITFGILAAVNRGGWFDNTTRVMAVVLNAVPAFWLGLLLMMIFGAYLKVLPMSGRCDPTTVCPPVFQRLEYLILPVTVLATGGLAGYSRYMRASMLDVVNQDYIRTARAKGLVEQAVWFGHAARNAAIPLATFLGPAIFGLLGGSVITETLFSWPGLGRLAIAAVNNKDLPLIMIITLIGAVQTVFGFILSDILYALVDPRIRFS